MRPHVPEPGPVPSQPCTPRLGSGLLLAGHCIPGSPLSCLGSPLCTQIGPCTASGKLLHTHISPTPFWLAPACLDQLCAISVGPCAPDPVHEATLSTFQAPHSSRNVAAREQQLMLSLLPDCQIVRLMDAGQMTWICGLDLAPGPGVDHPWFRASAQLHPYVVLDLVCIRSGFYCIALSVQKWNLAAKILSHIF